MSVEELETLEREADRAFGRALGKSDEEAWGEWTALGLDVAGVSEAKGGAGFGTAGAMVVARLSGKWARGGLLAETALANWALDVAGFEVEGGLRRAAATDMGFVAYGRELDELVREGDVGLEALEGEVEGEGENLAGEPRDAMGVKGGVRKKESPTGWLKETAALMRAAQMAGASESALEMTLEHVKTREQFGRPLGGFQAIQQGLAEAAGHAALARASVDAALGSKGKFMFACAAAKSVSGDAAGVVARWAHQAHGALGFSAEYGLHERTKRIWSWRDEHGSRRYWRGVLGRAVKGDGEALWEKTRLF